MGTLAFCRRSSRPSCIPALTSRASNTAVKKAAGPFAGGSPPEKLLFTVIAVKTREYFI